MVVICRCGLHCGHLLTRPSGRSAKGYCTIALLYNLKGLNWFHLCYGLMSEETTFWILKLFYDTRPHRLVYVLWEQIEHIMVLYKLRWGQSKRLHEVYISNKTIATLQCGLVCRVCRNQCTGFSRVDLCKNHTVQKFHKHCSWVKLYKSLPQWDFMSHTYRGLMPGYS